MNALIPLVVVVIGAGMAGAVLSIPDTVSLAFMRFKDGDHAGTLKVFEQHWRDGDTSINVIMPLVEIYRSLARPDAAVAPFEALAESRPDDMTARRMLGEVYRQAFRPADYTRNLERISRTAPTPDDLRELARLHRLTNDTARRIDALGRLFDLTGGSDGSVAELAELLAFEGRVGEAVAVLTRADEAGKDGLRGERGGREFLVTLLCDTGRADEAVARIGRWLVAGTIGPGEAIGYSWALAEAGRIDLATATVAGLHRRGSALDEAASVSLAYLDLRLGRQDDAREVLARWRESGVSPEKRSEFIHLALGAGSFDAALAELRHADPTAMPTRALAALAEIAFFSGSADIVEWLERTVGTPLYEARPLFAAELATQRGRTGQARYWAERAAAEPTLSTVERIRLGSVLERVGLRAEAGEQLRRVVDAGPVPNDALGSLALLFLSLDRSDEGHRYFSSLRDAPAAAAPGARTAIAWGWAWLAAAARRGADVIPLVEGGALDDAARLQDLHFIAGRHGEPALALAAARRLSRLRPDGETKIWLARALVAAGRSDEALPMLRRMMTAGDPVEDLYAEALERTGGGRELIALLERQAADNARPAAERRAIAFRLLNAGDRLAAQRVFTGLAADAPPDSPDVRQLAYLWGPRPGPEVLDWLERRARGATAAERPAWLGLLAAKGGAAGAIALIDAADPAERPGLRDPLIAALQRVGDTGRLAAEIALAVPDERDPARLAAYADGARAAGRTDLAERAWRRLLDVDPERPEALRNLGVLAAYRGDPATAVGLLGRLLVRSEGDFEVNRLHADALIALGRHREAQPYLERALAMLREKPARNRSDQVAEARILGLLGRTGALAAVTQPRPRPRSANP